MNDEEENGSIQVWCFSLTERREAIEFGQFFDKVKKKVGNIRYWYKPNTDEIYQKNMNGSIHLGRNIRSIFVNLYNFYEKNHRLVITEQELFEEAALK